MSSQNSSLETVQDLGVQVHETCTSDVDTTNDTSHDRTEKQGGDLNDKMMTKSDQLDVSDTILDAKDTEVETEELHKNSVGLLDDEWADDHKDASGDGAVNILTVAMDNLNVVDQQTTSTSTDKVMPVRGSISCDQPIEIPRKKLLAMRFKVIRKGSPISDSEEVVKMKEDTDFQSSAVPGQTSPSVLDETEDGNATDKSVRQIVAETLKEALNSMCASAEADVKRQPDVRNPHSSRSTDSLKRFRAKASGLPDDDLSLDAFMRFSSPPKVPKECDPYPLDVSEGIRLSDVSGSNAEEFWNQIAKSDDFRFGDVSKNSDHNDKGLGLLEEELNEMKLEKRPGLCDCLSPKVECSEISEGSSYGNEKQASSNFEIVDPDADKIQTRSGARYPRWPMSETEILRGVNLEERPGLCDRSSSKVESSEISEESSNSNVGIVNPDACLHLDQIWRQTESDKICAFLDAFSLPPTMQLLRRADDIDERACEQGEAVEQENLDLTETSPPLGKPMLEVVAKEDIENDDDQEEIALAPNPFVYDEDDQFLEGGNITETEEKIIKAILAEFDDTENSKEELPATVLFSRLAKDIGMPSEKQKENPKDLPSEKDGLDAKDINSNIQD